MLFYCLAIHEPKRVVVAIDGPAGAGKSTIARRLAERLSFTYIDTGAMYRAVALWALRCNIAWDDMHRLEQLAIARHLRVVFHAEHDLHADGGTDHSLLRGAEAAGLSARDLTRAGPLWPARIADAMARHPPMNGRRYGRSEAALEPTLPAGTRLLTSWIIAPV